MRYLAFLLLLWAAPAWADDLGCFEPSAVVPLPAHFILGTTSTAATSKSAYVVDSAGTLTATIADATFTQVNAANQPGKYRVPYTVPASPVLGKWTVSYKGTMSGTVYDFGDDSFEVKTACPLTPTVAGRALDVTAANKVNGVVLTDTATTLTNLPSIPANWLTAAGIAAGALNGKGDWNIGKTGYSLTVTPLAASTVLTELSQSIPSATPTVDQAIMLLYMCLVRSEVVTTTTEWRCKNDAGTVIIKRTVSDDGSTFTRGETVSGP